MLTSKGMMKMLKNQFKGRLSRWRLFAILICAILVAGALVTFNFIQQNINIALANTKVITTIKTNETFDVLDFSMYDRIKKIIDNKKTAAIFPKKNRIVFTYDKSLQTSTVGTFITTSTTNLASSTAITTTTNK